MIWWADARQLGGSFEQQKIYYLDEVALERRVLHVSRREEHDHERDELVLRASSEHVWSVSVPEGSTSVFCFLRSTSKQTHLEVNVKNSVMSSIRSSGSMRNTSGVSSGSGSLCKRAAGKSTQLRMELAENARDLHLRVCLLRVDHAHEPGHDKVPEPLATREVLGVEQLDLVRMQLALDLLPTFLRHGRAISTA